MGMVRQIKMASKTLLVLFGITAVVGCGMPPKRVYQPNPPDPSVQPFPWKVAVVELEDGSAGEGFKYPLLFNNAMIPGALYSTQLVKFHHTHFGKCLAAELIGTQMFASVEYLPNWEKLVTDFKSYDLIVTGRLLHDKVENKNFFYGLSLPGDILWFVGLPAEAASREVAFEIIAFNPLQPDQSVWDHQVTFEDSAAFGFYYGDRWGDVSSIKNTVNGLKITHTDLCTPELLQPEFIKVRSTLASALKKLGPGLTADGSSKGRSGERSGL